MVQNELGEVDRKRGDLGVVFLASIIFLNSLSSTKRIFGPGTWGQQLDLKRLTIMKGLLTSNLVCSL